MHGGRYDERVTLENKSGTLAEPIRILPADDQWITGNKNPDPARDPWIPSYEDPAFLCIDNCQHIIIEGLKIMHWWPGILHAKRTQWLTVRGCQLLHSSYAIVVKDSKDQIALSQNVLIEDNQWQQDDSLNHDLWSKIDWREAHGGEGTPGKFQYFNGAFFGAKNIRGKVIIRNNRISDAYNGIRMKSGDSPPPLTGLRKVNTNVHIFNNSFTRIRDNPIEPEVYAFNWHVRHNRLLDCHAWFSLDNVTGGQWYFYGNVGWFESRQGSLDDHAKDKHTMGRVLKLSYAILGQESGSTRVPTDPWFVFNNSWHLRCPVIGGANSRVPTVPAGEPGPDLTARLAFFNNAFAWCLSSPDDTWLCEPIELVRHFDMQHSSSVVFDHDICNRPDFMKFFQHLGWGEHHGITTTAPLFALPIDGKFALAAGSLARGSGWVDAEKQLPGIFALRLQADASINHGAVQDYGLTQVPELEREAVALLQTLGL